MRSPTTPRPEPLGWRRSDSLALGSALVLIAVAAVVGVWLEHRGVQLILPAPPLLSHWDPHVGWGTPLALGCVVLAVGVQRVAATLPWRRLLLVGWLLSLAWMVSLTLIDGLRRGWVNNLLNPNEYLEDLPRITSPAEFLRTFSHYIAFGPGVTGDDVWTTHVAGHPPLATLVFWALDRIGLGGGFWAGALCILVSSAVAVGLPVTLRELGAPESARRLVPFVALFPGAVWMAVSADGLFAGVAVGGLALVTLGASRGWWLVSLAGGLLLGAMLYLNYGLVLFGVVIILAFVLTLRRRGLRAVVLPWLAALVGVLVVVVIFFTAGFSWFEGLAELRVRYYQGIASLRPYSYFVWANFAAFVISCSPLLAPAAVRAVRTVRPEPGEGRVTALVCLAGLTAALIADLSGLSKAETERIWLPFGAVAYAGLVLFRGRLARWTLIACAVSALLVNHLLDTGW